jgi:hypothetical protein
MNVQTPNVFARMSTFHFLYNNFIVLYAASVRKEILQLLMLLLPLLSCVCHGDYILTCIFRQQETLLPMGATSKERYTKRALPVFMTENNEFGSVFKGSIRKRYNAL